MEWDLEHNTLDKDERRVYMYVLKQSKNKDLAQTVVNFISLRKYLDEHPFKTAEELRNNVVYNGRPIFSTAEAKQLTKLLEKKGGDLATDKPEVVDVLVRQWVQFLYEWQPAFVKDGEDVLSPYFFILKTLEADETFGPLLGISLEAATAALPAIAKSAQEISTTLGGPVGSIIGWMIASIFVGLAMMIHLSRDHFGQAFVVSFLLIPMLSNTLNSAAVAAQRVVTKATDRRQKLIDSTEKIFGKEVSEQVGYIIPDLFEDVPVPAPETGGKRLSRHRRIKSKWQTRRKSKP